MGPYYPKPRPITSASAPARKSFQEFRDCLRYTFRIKKFPDIEPALPLDFRRFRAVVAISLRLES